MKYSETAKSQKLYNASVLRGNSPQSNLMIHQMMSMFIQDAPKKIDEIIVHFNNNKQEEVKLLALQLLPSFKFLRIRYVVDILSQLIELKDKAKKAQLIKDLHRFCTRLFIQLSNDLSKKH